MNAVKTFVSRLDIPENRFLKVVYLLTEEKEEHGCSIESKILYCFEHYGTIYYSIELSFAEQDYPLVNYIKQLIR